MLSDAVAHTFANIAAITGGIVGVVVLFRKVIIPATRRFKATLERFDKIDDVLKELKPNGGTSLRDSINRIEDEMHSQTERLRSHDRKLDRLTQTQWALTQNARCGIFETDRSGAFIRVNQTFARIVGHAQDECRGHNWYNFVASEDRERVMTEWNDAVEWHRDVEISFNMQHSDGHTFKALLKAKALEDTYAGGDKPSEDALPAVSGWVGSVYRIQDEMLCDKHIAVALQQ